MSENLPSVTIVIAARPGQAEVKAVAGARALVYPAEKIELLLARGRQPSAQRNAALKVARGDWIYFLDDDSVAESRNLELAAAHSALADVQMVGGPNLCPPDAPWIEQVFALVLASWLAFGPSRARYARGGAVRDTSEKELILCNLMARRSAMLELGGFNEALYPNEENALMDELQRRGGRLMYDPSLIVYRRPRSNLRAFARMLLTYGRGRAEQFRVHPTAGSILNFVPPLFCIYLGATMAALLTGVRWGLWLLIPLAFYLVLVVGEGLALAGPTRHSRAVGFAARLGRAVAAMPLIVLTHVLYGLGFWRGLFTRLAPSERARSEVVLETVKELGRSDWGQRSPRPSGSMSGSAC